MEKPRKIIFNGERLPDIDPTAPIEDVKNHYAAQHPKLTTASVAFTSERGQDTYTFTEKVGTKG